MLRTREITDIVNNSMKYIWYSAKNGKYLLYICTKFRGNISESFQNFGAITISTMKFTKRHNSVNNLSGFTVLVFFI